MSSNGFHQSVQTLSGGEEPCLDKTLFAYPLAHNQCLRMFQARIFRFKRRDVEVDEVASVVGVFPQYSTISIGNWPSTTLKYDIL